MKRYPFQFDSKHYMPIHFITLAKQAIFSVIQCECTLGFLNPTGVVWLVHEVQDKEPIYLYSINGIIHTHKKNLASIHIYGLSEFSFHSLIDPSVNYISKNDLLSVGMLEIIKQLIIVVNQIYHYIDDFLSNRFYGDDALIKNALIKKELIGIRLLLTKMTHLVATGNNIIQQQYLIDLLLDCLHRLSVLGGARAILAHHSIDLFFHLFLLKKWMMH